MGQEFPPPDLGEPLDRAVPETTPDGNDPDTPPAN